MCHKRRRRRKISAAILAAVCLFTGCALQDTPEDQMIVKEKETSDEQTRTVSSKEGLTIADQVDAERSYKKALSLGNAEVLVHAEVEIPDGEGMKSRSSAVRFLDQNDLDGWIRTLTQGGALWQYLDGTYTERITYEEMEQWQEALEQKRQDVQIDEEERDEIAQWSEICGYYLDTDVLLSDRDGYTEEIPWQLPEPEVWDFDEPEPESAQREEGKEEDVRQGLYGLVDVPDVYAPWSTGETHTYTCRIENERQDGVTRSEFRLVRQYRWDYEIWNGDEQVWQETETGVSKKEMRKAADALVEQLGLSDELMFDTAEAVYALTDYNPYGQRFLYDGKAWRFVYTRSVDGIPVSYQPGMILSDEGRSEVEQMLSAETDAEVSYELQDSYAKDEEEAGENQEAEYFCVTFDDEGLVSVVWHNPSVVEETSNDNVFLLPFSEIEQIFERSMPRQTVMEMFSEAGYEIQADITQIRLSYMRVSGEDGESAKIVPVWDFIGTLYSSAEEHMEENGLSYSIWTKYFFEKRGSDSLITINAMDGTVIERGYGG